MVRTIAKSENRVRHVRFGAGGAVSGLSASQTLDLAQSADELGYDLFSLSDHLHSTAPTLEPLSTLSWLAGKTSNITLASNVLGLPYRDPAVVAKTAETIAQLSGGRFVLGLGSGGFEKEFASFGLQVRSPGHQVTALREAIEIVRGLWTGEPTTIAGEHFSTVDAQIDPRPVHRIPIWLGTYGPKALALTGQVADGWLPSLGRITVADAAAKREVVRSSARAAGRDPDMIAYACNVRVRIDPRRSPTPSSFEGSIPIVVDELVKIVEAGFDVLLVAAPTIADQEVLAAEVFPEVRSRTGGALLS